MPDHPDLFSSALFASISLTLFISPILLYRRNRSARKREKYYEKEDGTPTVHAQRAFDRQSRIRISVMLVVSAFGFVINISAAVLLKIQPESVLDHQELLLIILKASAAVCLTAQCLFVALTRSTTNRQDQATIAGICSILVYGANIGYDLEYSSTVELYTLWLIAHCGLMLASALACFTIPRRPRYFRSKKPEKPVDREHSVSVLSRYTLSWANPLLSEAARRGGIELQGLPYLRARMAADALVRHFHSYKTSRLWKRIARAHVSAFTTQWILTVVWAFVTLAPQYCLYRLINTLEGGSERSGSNASLWLILLGVSQFVQPWTEAWALWIGWCHIALPIYVQISGLLIEKSTRRKDIKAVGADSEAMGSKSAQDDKKDEDIPTPKTAQDQINLITVDTQRLTDFLSYNSMVLGTFLNIVLSFCFLVSFIRIESILIGLASISLLVPLNIYANGRYAAAQNALMSARDVKTSTLTECIQGIRQVKFDALEPQWGERIRGVRDMELSRQWKAYLAETLLMMCWIAGSYVFAAVTLSSISIHEGGLRPSVAFTALAVFQRLEATLSLVPGLFTDFYDAWISCDRLERFLASTERFDDTVDDDFVAFEDAFVDWPSEDQSPRHAKLHSLDFKFPKDALSIIAGPTGSGKSLLLSAIVGEADIISGTVRRPRSSFTSYEQGSEFPSTNWIIPNTMALVAQTPWIENATIRDNILFGLPLAESRYRRILESCALLQDLGTMEDGDMTEVGAHGIGLSGGQRSRLSLARALYSRAEVLVIDDVFSAVDTHVGRHILDHALTGEVAHQRAIILATHSLQLCLPKSTFVVMLNDGTAEFAGPSTDVPQRFFSKPIDDMSKGDDEGMTSAAMDEDSLTIAGIRKKTAFTLENSQSDLSAVSSDYSALIKTKVDKPNNEPKTLVQEEGREKGRVKLSVYRAYLATAGAWPWLHWLVVISLLLGFESALIARNLWVKFWSDRSHTTNMGSSGLEALGQEIISKSGLFDFQMIASASENAPAYFTTTYSRNTYYVTGCILISLLASFLGTFKFFWVYLGSLRASRHLFGSMTMAMLHAPLRWLDTVPKGRILNRFTADFNVIDSALATDLVMFVHSGLQLTGIVVAGALISPWLLLIFVPLLAVCILYARMYLAGARDVKRLQSVKKSPILEQIDSLLSGLATIRAWDRCRSYTDDIYSKIDDHARCVWHLWLFNRWLGIRFAVIGSVFTIIVAAFSVYSPVVSASLAGLALTFSLDFTQSVFWVLRRYADLEMDMNSLERIVEYCTVPSETSDGIVPPAHWPSRGRVEVSDLVVGYDVDVAPVLQGISFTCEPKSRVGLVGRTGAGKSSLTLALFRFLEARAGSVVIDGLDIATLALKELRERMAIIPQHPVLWLGTLRSNLDPFNSYGDDQLIEVLERVQLSHQSTSVDVSNSEPEAESGPHFTLSTAIAEGGANISLGQRQLVCLARALLAQPKIFIMDEATSAVDADTDSIVQQTIRSEFANSTMLVIAHKLSTVIDLDQIIVLEEGKIVEMGPPKELWEEGGAFAQMVAQSREKGLMEKLRGFGKT